NEEGKTELSDLKEQYEKAEQEKQSIADELQGCQAEMKLLHEKGAKRIVVERYTLHLVPVGANILIIILRLLFPGQRIA
ncbi:hypothetical protein CRUP_000297, partial [Coryphaenoides rupestris]